MYLISVHICKQTVLKHDPKRILIKYCTNCLIYYIHDKIFSSSLPRGHLALLPRTRKYKTRLLQWRQYIFLDQIVVHMWCLKASEFDYICSISMHAYYSYIFDPSPILDPLSSTYLPTSRIYACQPYVM